MNEYHTKRAGRSALGLSTCPFHQLLYYRIQELKQGFAHRG